jgi:hypothetical protein
MRVHLCAQPPWSSASDARPLRSRIRLGLSPPRRQGVNFRAALTRTDSAFATWCGHGWVCLLRWESGVAMWPADSWKQRSHIRSPSGSPPASRPRRAKTPFAALGDKSGQRCYAPASGSSRLPVPNWASPTLSPVARTRVPTHAVFLGSDVPAECVGLCPKDIQ